MSQQKHQKQSVAVRKRGSVDRVGLPDASESARR